MEDAHFNSSYFWSPVPAVPGQVGLDYLTLKGSTKEFTADCMDLWNWMKWSPVPSRLRMPCSWTKWKSSRRRMLRSLLPRRPTTKQLSSPSRLPGRRQMEAVWLVVRRTSTLLTAPRTSQCCLSPPRASWQQVGLFLLGEAFRGHRSQFLRT